MLIEKLKKIDSLGEMISIFIAINFIVQISFKVGFLNHFGYWSIALFNPIEIMFGNLQLLLIYILIFSYIYSEESVITMIIGILIVTVIPFISAWLYGAGFDIQPLYIFGIIVGVFGILLKKIAIGTHLELGTIIIILCLFPLLYGVFAARSLHVDELSQIGITKGDTVEQWFIIDKFSDSFLTISKDKTTLKIIKLDQADVIYLPK